jgi:hypothetical protein
MSKCNHKILGFKKFITKTPTHCRDLNPGALVL